MAYLFEAVRPFFLGGGIGVEAGELVELADRALIAELIAGGRIKPSNTAAKDAFPPVPVCAAWTAGRHIGTRGSQLEIAQPGIRRRL